MHRLERKVLELIGEDPDNPDVFTDDELGMAPVRDSLNDAIQEVQMLEGANRRQYFIPLRSGQQIYRLDLNYGYVGWITDVWLINKKYRLEQTSVVRLTAHDPRWMVSSADPRSYFPIGSDSICVYPKPSASSDTLEVTIVEIPIAYTDSNSKVHIKSDFEYAAIHYAVSEYWASRGDAREALKHFKLYLDAMGLREEYDQHAQVRQFRTQKGPYPQETT
jgi:hypothetical protein